MTDRSVAIRLGTTGKAEVKGDLAEIGATGKSSFDGIGDAAESSARRASAAYDRATADIAAAQQRQSNAAAKIAAISPQTATQFRINQSVGTGFGDYEGSARQSAAAFRELIGYQGQLEAKARAIKAAIDPLTVAQDRYTNALNEARAALAAGLISGTEFEAFEVRLRGELDQTTAALRRQGGVSGQVRAGSQQLAFQISDVATQYAAATPVMLIFAQQGSQVVQAISLMRAEAGGFIGFLAGPWGAVILGAISIIGVLATKSDDAGKAHRAHADAADDLSGAIDALDKQTQGLVRSQQAERVETLNAASALRQKALDVRKVIAAQVDAARAEVEASKIRSSGPGQRGELGTLALDVAERQLARLNALASKAQADVDNATVELRRAAVPVLQQSALETIDKAAAATGKYQRDVDALNKSLQDGKLTVAQYQSAYATLTASHESALDTIRESEKSHRGLSEAQREQAKDAREAAAAQRALDQALSGIEGRFDPAAAAARRYAETLAELAKLRAAGMISQDQLEQYRSGAGIEAVEADASARRSAGDRAIASAGLQSTASLVDPDRLREGDREFQRWIEDLNKVSPAFEEIHAVGDRVLNDVLNPDNWSDWGRLGQTVLRDIQSEFIKLALLNPLKNFLFGEANQTIGSIFGFASGTEHFAGGFALAGEFGPELISAPRGSRIATASQTRRMLAGDTAGVGSTIVYDLRGAVVYEDLMQKVEARAQQAAAQGAAGGAALARVQTARAQRFKLP